MYKTDKNQNKQLLTNVFNQNKIAQYMFIISLLVCMSIKNNNLPNVQTNKKILKAKQ